MTGRTKVILAGGVVFAVVGWALFRPELLFVNKTVNEALPVALTTSANAPQTQELAAGMFVSGAHETKGTATVLQVDGGRRVLRLTGFETSNGPDVRVLLVSGMDITGSDAVKNAQRVELGKLKGNVGDQNYDIPAAVQLDKYQSVVIWCNRFGVNFGSATLMTSTMMMETMPTAAKTLISGMFHSGAHETKGTATVYQLTDGKRLLRLSGFETSNGPDVRVLLIAAGDATDNDTVKNAERVELGKLKGNIGDQNYDVPADLDLSRFKAVTIWCNRFSVNFGTAPLG